MIISAIIWICILFGLSQDGLQAQQTAQAEQAVQPQTEVLAQQNPPQQPTRLKKPADIPAISRFSFTLADSNGVSYEAFVFASDEQVSIETSDWAGGTAGEQVYRGTYQLAVRKTGGAALSTPQPLPFAEPTEFHQTRNNNYKIPAPKRGQPDLLVISQHGSSNGKIVILFFIKDGQITPIRFHYSQKVEAYQKFVSQEIAFSGDYTYRTVAYDNSIGKWITEVWRFDPKEALMRLQTRTFQ